MVRSVECAGMDCFITSHDTLFYTCTGSTGQKLRAGNTKGQCQEYLNVFYIFALILLQRTGTTSWVTTTTTLTVKRQKGRALSTPLYWSNHNF